MVKAAIALIVVWVVTLVRAQKKHRSERKWWNTPISNYITLSQELVIGFVLLALGFVFMGLEFDGVVSYLFFSSAVGAIGVMITKDRINSIPHGIAAVVTYLSALAACVIVSLSVGDQFLLGIAVANILYIAYSALVNNNIASIERTGALGIITWIVMFEFI